MTNISIPIFCGECGATGSVGKVTASLRCPNCQSGNLGLVGVDARPSVAVAQRHQAGAAAPGVGTGWGQPMPDTLQGWNEYVGPTPQTFPRAAPVADPVTCPVCHGSKYDLIDKGPCRECGGTGVITHPTDRPPVESYDGTSNAQPAGGAAWHGASRTASATDSDEAHSGECWTCNRDFAHRDKLVDHVRKEHGREPRNSKESSLQGGLSAEAMARIGGRPSADPYGSPEYHIQHTTPGYNGNPDKLPNTSPNVKYRDDRDYSAPAGPYQMDQASCPNCSHAPTQLVKDKNEDAWWHCPNCGPLANIDRRPEVNPYAPAPNFEPDRNMKTGGFLSRNRKTGRLLTMLARIHDVNDLDSREAVELARKTLIRYPEGR